MVIVEQNSFAILLNPDEKNYFKGKLKINIKEYYSLFKSWSSENFDGFHINPTWYEKQLDV